MELPFAALQQLCASMSAELDLLPVVQRDALRTAFGLAAGDAPDRFLVGTALLGLLIRASRDRPVICTVDDAQWIDVASRQALAFVARRLGDNAIAIVAASRIPHENSKARDLPELMVEGLTGTDARALLDSVLTGPMGDAARDTFIAETRGNPLAILELARETTPERLAGGYGLAGDLTGRIEASFRRRLTRFPAQTCLLLLVAAADPALDPILTWRVADRLGLTMQHAHSAVDDGYVDLDGQIRFCHPLARSTAYRSATSAARHEVHRLIADAIEGDVDSDRRAWHRAHAATGLDEAVADELERSAGRARARGGVAAAAAFLERAAELTPDPDRRSHRALVAARAKYQAGAFERALRLLAIADRTSDEITSAKAELLRAQIAISAGTGWEGPLLQAGERLEDLDPEVARQTLGDAFAAALTAGRLATHGGVREVARTARLALDGRDGAAVADDLLNGLVLLVNEGYAVGAPPLRRALTTLLDGISSIGEDVPWLPLACRVAHNLWDEDAYDVLSDRLLRVARARGEFGFLPFALSLRIGSLMFQGQFAEVALLVKECDALARATASSARPYGAVWVSAWQGDPRTLAMIDAATGDMTERREGQWIPAAAWAAALVHNATGNYEAALICAETGSACPEEFGLATWCLVELVEAAARTGSAERAADAMQRLSEMAHACPTNWALGVHARLSAMLDDSVHAESKYREAIRHLGQSRIRTELARAHLVYGEWLRRHNRRADARQELRIAVDMFAEMDLRGFADRARRELLATGETVRRRTVDTANNLTPQEIAIVRLAAAGHTNPEIAGQLFISPRTVEWHLRKVFPKLGVRSRRELRAMNATRYGRDLPWPPPDSVS